MVDIVNIAPAAGLPDIAFGAAIAAVTLLTADDPLALGLFGAPQWGVFSGGTPIITADTVIDLGYSKSYAISDYPIEDGGFASFDKVEQPFEARVRFASGGSPAVRQALISSVETILGDLNLYDVATPDQTYINANLVREEYRRTQSDGGGSLLLMDVSLQEVRILAGNTSSNPSDPASADQQNNGTVQPQTAPAGQGGIGSDAVAGSQASQSGGIGSDAVAGATLPPTLTQTPSGFAAGPV